MPWEIHYECLDVQRGMNTPVRELGIGDSALATTHIVTGSKHEIPQSAQDFLYSQTFGCVMYLSLEVTQFGYNMLSWGRSPNGAAVVIANATRRTS